MSRLRAGEGGGSAQAPQPLRGRSFVRWSARWGVRPVWDAREPETSSPQNRGILWLPAASLPPEEIRERNIPQSCCVQILTSPFIKNFQRCGGTGSVSRRVPR